MHNIIVPSSAPPIPKGELSRLRCPDLTEDTQTSESSIARSRQGGMEGKTWGKTWGFLYYPTDSLLRLLQ